MSINRDLHRFPDQDYPPGRTKQSFKDETDINKLIARAARGETISHLAKYEGVYGDFTDFPDLMEAQARLMRGQQIFDELPGEVKREFGQDAGRFFEYVNDPANADRLGDLIPGLAQPGNQMPEPRRTPDRQLADPQPDPGAAEPAAPAVDPEPQPG
jgi:hypothetical protein